MALSFLFLHVSLSPSLSLRPSVPLLNLRQGTPPAMTSSTPYLLPLARLLSFTAASCPLKAQGREVKHTSRRKIKQKRAREAMGQASCRRQ